MIDLENITDEQVEKFEEGKKRAFLAFEGTWVRDIPFYLVPVEIVMGFKGNRFTPEEFYLSKEWSLPSYWNAGFVKDGKVVIFLYGRFSDLERELYLGRIGADPSFQEYGNKVIQLALDEVERIAKEKGLEYIWMMTDRKGLDKKRSGRGRKRTDKFILENDKF